MNDHTLANSAMSKPQDEVDVGRRRFLKLSGGTLSLSLIQLGGVTSEVFIKEVFAGEREVGYEGRGDLYRDIWKWDKISWGSHTNACVPGGCSFHVYVKDGIVWREEQAMQNDASNAAYPDYNPMGCQKGCSFHFNIYGDDRVTHPLRRVGERGSGRWERISWEEALDEVAAAIVDGIEEFGPDSFILDGCHFHAGSIGFSGVYRFNRILGGVSPNWSVLNGDSLMGFYQTMGKMQMGFTADNLFDAELIIMSCANWSYTAPPLYHFITEARYNGAEIVNVNPDYNPSTIHADYHAPVKPGGDAAFWLGMAQVIVTEGLFDKAFLCEQTDLGLLRRKDTRKFLRQSDLNSNGRANQFYFWNLIDNSLTEAPRGTLAFEGEQALEGVFEVTLADGSIVEVEPVFAALRRRLESEYDPQNAADKSGVDASLIRELARKMASRRTLINIGWNSGKVYHGDLGERAMLLVSALTGNWGKPGTGQSAYAMPADHVELLMLMDKPLHEGGLEFVKTAHEDIANKLRAEDPTVSDEMISLETAQSFMGRLGWVPPAIWLYRFCGYDELFDNLSWQDPKHGRAFGDCLEEAMDRDWWGGDMIRPAPGKEPRVFMVCGGNPMRKTRSGALMYPKHLFPKLKMMFTIDPRMSFTALHSDIVLPAAWYYERQDMTATVTSNPRYTYIEQAVEPRGEARHEWRIFSDLFRAIANQAKQRGLVSYKNFWGEEQRYDELWDRFTMRGHLETHDDAFEELVKVAEAVGAFPKDTTIDTLKRDGLVPLGGMGEGTFKHMTANEFDHTKPFYSLRWHVDDKLVFPTETRRAQFYLDHDWYLEADEYLPVYKEAPKIGGDYPFALTGGHPRHSIHSTHSTQPELMRLHRGQPVMHMNDEAATERGIENGEMVEVYNDLADFRIMVRTSPTVAPEQVVIYMWEGQQFEDWKIFERLAIGQPKPLQLARGTEHFRYYGITGSPPPTADRSVRVNIRKLEKA